MNITILDDYQNAVRTFPSFKKVEGHNVTIWNDHLRETDKLAERLKDTEALVLIRERTKVSAPLIERLGKLKLISQFGRGRHLDVDACTRRGIIVSAGVGGPGPGRSYTTAELTWGLIIDAFRRIPQEIAALKAGKWQAYPIGVGLRGKTLGVFGFGRIGSTIAGYGKAFGMNVIVWGRESTLDKARAAGYDTAPSREEFFGNCDVVSLHIGLNDATIGIVTRADLARMKPTALFVNTSRAGLVETGALEEAARAGRPGMAAVDVFDDEPIYGGNHPLLKMDNVICTPHLGYAEFDGLNGMLSVIFDQILAYADGKPINVINPAVLEKKTS